MRILLIQSTTEVMVKNNVKAEIDDPINRSD